MDIAFDLMTVKLPANIAPYATYVRTLDRFNEHASELSSVLLLISHRNKDAKRAGLGTDDAFKTVGALLQEYFHACRPELASDAGERENPADIREAIHTILAGYKADAANMEYFDQWLTGYGLNAVDLASAEANLELARNG